jgi:hypothetical protein
LVSETLKQIGFNKLKQNLNSDKLLVGLFGHSLLKEEVGI